ncbi:MAG TPA: phosphatase PAP2 family protein [Rhizomicrobium sp.]|nr:phosphatase PAP2 family protein [Rhizomicrobium sp.]
MSDRLRLEWRFTALIALIVGSYVAAVALYANAHNDLQALAISGLNPLVVLVFGSTLGLLLGCYVLRSAWRARKQNTVALVWADVRQGALRRDQLIARLTIFAGWFCMMLAFSPFKYLIGRVRGFPFDPMLLRIGHVLFFGHDGWQITHAMFGSPVATAILQMVYSAWFFMVWLSIIYCIVRSDDARFRMQFLLAFLLCWILVGSVAAYWLASAGPCFYQHIFGDAHFAPLMNRLHMLDQKIAAVAPGWRLLSIDEQNWLWNSYADSANAFGAGISAMPSMHVAFAALMARGGFAIDRRTGWILSISAVLIWIASIHLGWHYTIDGIVGAPMGVATWYLAGWMLRALVFGASARPSMIAEGPAA